MKAKTVNIRGNAYETIDSRVVRFREEYPLWTIDTRIERADSDAVLVRAEILDESGRLISSGYAEESRSTRGINATSALENAETSAVGRALAFFKYAGHGIASAEEVSGAIERQEAGDTQASDELLVTIREYQEAGEIPEATIAWLDERKWSLTTAQAEKIIERARNQ